MKQTDFNGNFTYSNLVSVDFNGNSDLSFSVYPNPADGASLINLSLTTAKGQEVLVQIYDVTGKESYENRFLVKDNSEQIYAIELSQQLSPGIYLMMLTADQKRFSNKLIVK